MKFIEFIIILRSGAGIDGYLEIERHPYFEYVQQYSF